MGKRNKKKRNNSDEQSKDHNKSKTKPVVKRNKQHPFTWKEVMPDEDAEWKEISIRGQNGATVRLSADFLVINGTELPELYLKWSVQFEINDQNNVVIALQKWPGILRMSSSGEGNRIIGDCLKANHDCDCDVWTFTNPTLNAKIYDPNWTQQMYYNYLDTREYMEDVVADVMWCLGNQYFGTDKMSQSAYWHLRRLIYGRKIGNQSIREYHTWIEQLNKYLRKLPTTILHEIGETPEALTDRQKTCYSRYGDGWWSTDWALQRL